MAKLRLWMDTVVGVMTTAPWSRRRTGRHRQREAGAHLLAIFAAVAVSLAALGIYGVLANVVAQQTKELGLRLALGAAPGSVLWLVLRRALIPTVAGIALGLIGAFALTRVMSGLLYEVQPHDAIAFVGGSVALAALVMLSSLVPAVRATRVDPIVALRTE